MAMEKPDADPVDMRTENPGNFKRTPPEDDLEKDPLDSGRGLRSNHLLMATLALGLVGALFMALMYLD